MKNLKKTNEVIDELIKNRPLVRIDNYIGSLVKINFKCLKCHNIWMVKPYNILNKNGGCPKCCKNVKLTESIANLKLQNKPIIRVGLFVNATTRTNFKCLKCEHIWETTYSSIFSGRGCTKCANRITLTDSMIDEKIKDKPILRISSRNIDKPKEKVEFKCLKCNKNWKTTLNKILNNNRGCHYCAKKFITNEILDESIKNRYILRIDDVISCIKKINFKCLKCNNIWKTSPAIIRMGSGCPQCCMRKNEKIVKLSLEKHKINFNYNFLINNISNIHNEKYRVDFYIPNKNIILEYNGEQHYRPVKFGGISIERANLNFAKQQVRDKSIETFCHDNKIKLIWIDGRKYKDKKLERYIQDELIPILKDNA